jgi:outer membrane protein TolC
MALLAYLLVGAPLAVFSQDTITLANLYKAIEQRNPLAKIPVGIDSIYDLKQRNMRVSYLPKLDLNAQATWQSDITAISIPVPGLSVPSPDRDQYKLTLDVSQLIWDGGVTRARSEVEEMNRMIEKNRVDAEVFSLKERAANIYFSLLMLNVSKRQFMLMMKEFDKRIAELESGIRAGTVLKSSLDALLAERLRVMQNLEGIPAQGASLRSMLSSLTGVPIGANDTLVVPAVGVPGETGCLRPEIRSFAIQHNLLQATSALTARRRYPILAGFAQAGYGKPGLNMLSSDWDTYCILGAKLSWNIWDWNAASTERQQLKVQGSIVDYRKQAYLDSYNAQVDGMLQELKKLENQLEKDAEIVRLLTDVAERSASSLRNGTVTASAYIIDVNNLARAKLEMELRRLKLAMQKVLLNNQVGLNINS